MEGWNMTMTKELDARARAYAKKMCEQYGGEQQIWTDSYNTYIEIAAEQRKVDEADYTEQMRQLNEEWKENLDIQRQMLTDKACEILRNNGTFAKIAEEEGATPEMVENTFKKMMEDIK